MKQIELLKKQPKAYGGELLRTRKGRSGPRPLDTRNTMHLVLRSAKAKGDWSFKRPQNERRITEIIAKFSHKYGIKTLSLANVGNHLHLQIKLGNRFTYNPFIRAITAAIAMAITGANRWSKLKNSDRFWDYRPYTRVIKSFKALLNLRDYIQINKLEGYGVHRSDARLIVSSGSFRTFGDSS